jgi:tetratricopeptide (TPR) repeat protein
LPGSLVYRRDAGTKTEPVLLVQIELPFKPVRRATPAPPYNIRYKPPVRSPRAEAATVDVKSPESQAGGDLPKLEQALQLFGEARYHEVLSVLDTIVSQSPDIRSNQLKLAAQTWTNLGQYDRAMQVLADALELEPFSAELFYLKAYIEELTGVKDDAIRSLEKAIYLNGEFVPAYIELSSLLALSEREQRARRLRQTALNLLSALPGDTQVSPYAGVRVDELIVFLTQLTDPAKVTL